MAAGESLQSYLLLGISLILSLVFVQVARWISFRTNRLAYPRKDRWHQRPTAMLGGVGIYAAFIAGVLIFIPEWIEYWPLLTSGTVMFILGFYDDLFELSPAAKIIGQILAGSILIFAGFRIQFFEFELANILVTFGWLIAITNAMNLIDNMDGLASGIAVIVAGFLAFYFARIPDQSGYFQMTLILIGAAAGFLFFNFPPARIFMGDSGSMFLGFTLAGLAVIRRASASNVFAVLGIPLLLFLLPILDTALVAITRVLRGQSPLQGGRDHTSHRLIAFGLSERQTLLVLYLAAIVSGVASTIIERVDYEFSLIFVPLLIVVMAILAAYLGRLKVVTSQQASDHRNLLTRVFVDLTYRRRMLEVLLDLFLISLSYYAALWLQGGFDLTDANLDFFLQSLPILLGISYLALFLTGVYRQAWVYFGLRDLLVLFQGVLLATLVSGVVLSLLYAQQIAFSAFLLYGIILIFGLSATRSSFRVLDQIYATRILEDDARVLIIDASATGVLIARWMMANPTEGYHPIGFLDPDFKNWGREIEGIRILGGVTDFHRVIENVQLDGVILTVGKEAHSTEIDQVVRVCQEKGIWIRKLQISFEDLE